MKICTSCEQKLPLSEFYQRRGSYEKRFGKIGYQSRCKTCLKGDRKLEYEKNRGYYAAKAKEYLNEANRIIRDRKKQPCSDCKLTFHYAAMQFDHRDPSLKKYKISSPKLKRSIPLLLAELEKCDLVCSNCHAIREWKRAQV